MLLSHAPTEQCLPQSSLSWAEKQDVRVFTPLPMEGYRCVGRAYRVGGLGGAALIHGILQTHSCHAVANECVRTGRSAQEGGV